MNKEQTQSFLGVLSRTERKKGDVGQKTKGVSNADLLEEEIKDRVQNRDERKKYAERAFDLVYHYLIVLALILFFGGSGFLRFSDSIYIAMISTLGTSIIGLFHYVMKYLFK